MHRSKTFTGCNDLLDHLVGAGEQRRRHVKRSRGLDVDRQLELGRRLHRQVTGLLTFQDSIDVAGRSSHLLELSSSTKILKMQNG